MPECEHYDKDAGWMPPDYTKLKRICNKCGKEFDEDENA